MSQRNKFEAFMKQILGISENSGQSQNRFFFGFCQNFLLVFKTAFYEPDKQFWGLFGNFFCEIFAERPDKFRNIFGLLSERILWDFQNCTFVSSVFLTNLLKNYFSLKPPNLLPKMAFSQILLTIMLELHFRCPEDRFQVFFQRNEVICLFRTLIEKHSALSIKIQRHGCEKALCVCVCVCVCVYSRSFWRNFPC